MAFIVEGYNRDVYKKSDSGVCLSDAFGDTGERFRDCNGDSASATQPIKLDKSDFLKTAVCSATESTASSRTAAEDDLAKSDAAGVSAGNRRQSSPIETARREDGGSTQRPQAAFSKLCDAASSSEFQAVKSTVYSTLKSAGIAAYNVTKTALFRLNGSVLCRKYEKQFRKGKSASAQNYHFRLGDDAVSVIAYSGQATVLKMPNTVLHRPIVYVAPGFLDTDAKTSLSITKLRLPKYLEVLPDNALAGCSNLDFLIMPPDLKFVCRKAFKGTNPAIIYFTGKCPAGLECSYVPRRTKLLCMPKFADTFSKIQNVRVYRG